MFGDVCDQLLEPEDVTVGAVMGSCVMSMGMDGVYVGRWCIFGWVVCIWVGGMGVYSVS